MPKEHETPGEYASPACSAHEVDPAYMGLDEASLDRARFDYRQTGHEIRADIAAAHCAYWQTLARPGSWWTGAERVAIAAESRAALTCDFCRERKQALSPYTLQGTHDSVTELPARAVDAVHRIVTDQGRITRAWIEDNAEHGLSKEAYVELVGVVVCAFSIDEFHRGLGLPLEPLPAPEAGEPNHYRPAILSEDMGFVPTVPPEGNQGNETDLWAGGRAANVVRALTLVPNALRDWRALAGAQYLSFEAMRNFVKDDNRALDRMQMELVAGRVSAVNECFY